MDGMKKPMKKDEPNSEIIIYESEGGEPHIYVRVENETVWLSQAQLVELFHSSKANVSEHIKHILAEGELERHSVVRKFRTTALARIIHKCCRALACSFARNESLLRHP